MTDKITSTVEMKGNLERRQNIKMGFRMHHESLDDLNINNQATRNDAPNFKLKE